MCFPLSLPLQSPALRHGKASRTWHSGCSRASMNGTVLSVGKAVHNAALVLQTGGGTPAALRLSRTAVSQGAAGQAMAQAPDRSPSIAGRGSGQGRSRQSLSGQKFVPGTDRTTLRHTGLAPKSSRLSVQPMPKKPQACRHKAAPRVQSPAERRPARGFCRSSAQTSVRLKARLSLCPAAGKFSAACGFLTVLFCSCRFPSQGQGQKQAQSGRSLPATGLQSSAALQPDGLSARAPFSIFA